MLLSGVNRRRQLEKAKVDSDYKLERGGREESILWGRRVGRDGIEECGYN